MKNRAHTIPLIHKTQTLHVAPEKQPLKSPLLNQTHTNRKIRRRRNHWWNRRRRNHGRKRRSYWNRRWILRRRRRRRKKRRSKSQGLHIEDAMLQQHGHPTGLELLHFTQSYHTHAGTVFVYLC